MNQKKQQMLFAFFYLNFNKKFMAKKGPEFKK